MEKSKFDGPLDQFQSFYNSSYVDRRKFKIIMNIEGPNGIKIKKEHIVEHIHYTAWPDHSIPEDPEAINALLGVAFIDCADFLTDQHTQMKNEN